MGLQRLHLRSRTTKSLAGPDNKSTENITALREQIDELTAQVKKLVSRVGGREERQEEAAEAAQKALEMIKEMGEEDVSAHALAELRDRRGGRDRKGCTG